jgi:hypothetical protein
MLGHPIDPQVKKYLKIFDFGAKIGYRAPFLLLPRGGFCNLAYRSVDEVRNLAVLEWLPCIGKFMPTPGKITPKRGLVKEVGPEFCPFVVAVGELPDIGLAAIESPIEKVIAIGEIEIPNRPARNFPLRSLWK